MAWTDPLPAPAPAPAALDLSASDVALVLAAAAALWLLGRAARWAFRLLPLGRSARARWSRFAPLVEGAVWLLFAVSALAWTLTGHPEVRLVALALVALGVVAAAWSTVRDYVSGVVLRSEGTLAVGDAVRVGEVEGLVTRLGGRAVELELPRGDRLVLPYHRVGASAVVRRTRARAAHTYAHTFTVAVPAALTPEVARQRVRRVVLTSHGVPPRHPPKIALAGSGHLEVTLHTLTDTRAAEVEGAVRAALSAL